MKKYLEFAITKIDDNKCYLICTTFRGLTYYKKKIERYLNKINFVGNLYVDQVTVAADGYNRFAIIPFKNNELIFEECEHLDLGEEYKRITTNFFYNNPEIIDKYTLIPDYILEKFAKNEPT